ncbi:unnamed protein product [Paramecium primaurelia]|uniref:WD domain, G-beta repeat protein n=1 Tax=Paramecium primaurelia TaxID=5886 RepID=A0A8S1MWT7_PARPR|nr:unnamed protein product [Paramecium primaurelia]
MSSSQGSPFTSKFYRESIEDCFNKAQEVIESSYNKISQSIDQILLDSVLPRLPSLQFESANQQSSSLKSSTIPKEFIYPILINQITTELRQPINSIVQREVNKSEQKQTEVIQSLKQQVENQKEERKKEQRDYLEIINTKNSEIKQLNEKQIIEENYIQKIKQVQDSNKFTFELMEQNSIKVDNYCYAFAFNKDQSIVLAGCQKDIKVFENQQGKLNQVQLLSKHTNQVFTLNFMKKTNNFVSGSSDNSIIIWQVIANNQWNCQQILNGHSNWIFCLLLNNTDDLIISGSVDKTIKFWMKQNQWICQQTINDHAEQVYSLSLNEQQNKLISCSLDSQILIIEQSKLDKQWSVIQKIIVDQYGQRLCFINDNLFTFQPYCKDQMYIYEMDTNNKQYNKIKEIAVKCDSSYCDCLFPQQYRKSKCLLVNKNGKNVNLMRKKQNGDFIIQQSIQFGHQHIYGQLSDDGEYLITWDLGSKEIQIRKCKDQ